MQITKVMIYTINDNVFCPCNPNIMDCSHYNGSEMKTFVIVIVILIMAIIYTSMPIIMSNVLIRRCAGHYVSWPKI